MVFSSAIFLFCFLPAVFLLYRLPFGRRWQNALLACASLVFYAFGNLHYVPLFLLSVLLNYATGLLLGGRLQRSKPLIALNIVLNLGILCVFKYTDFLIGNANALFGLTLKPVGLILPIGISFYTFQGLSYTIDVYRKPEEYSRSFLKLLLYISFFPQLIAGPIVRWGDIAAQIDERVCTPEKTSAGIRRFLVGLGKKLLLADTAAIAADAIFAASLPDARLAWLGGICYSLQIYFDFSGYSDMAIGMGRMFGFSLKENFLFPYTADSIRDFWRKWHISLSTWFREYLYIPLGGSRCSRARAALNRLIVFFCTGLWHGANWTFVLWGLGHGLAAVHALSRRHGGPGLHDDRGDVPLSGPPGGGKPAGKAFLACDVRSPHRGTGDGAQPAGRAHPRLSDGGAGEGARAGSLLSAADGAQRAVAGPERLPPFYLLPVLMP